MRLFGKLGHSKAAVYMAGFRTLLTAQAKPKPRHVLIKLSKANDKENFENSKKQCIIYKESSIRLSSAFSKDTLETRRQWGDIFKGIKTEKTVI